MPKAKCIKPDAVPTIFSRSINYMKHSSIAVQTYVSKLVSRYLRNDTKINKLAIHI